jgi:primosomal protein N''
MEANTFKDYLEEAKKKDQALKDLKHEKSIDRLDRAQHFSRLSGKVKPSKKIYKREKKFDH